MIKRPAFIVLALLLFAAPPYVRTVIAARQRLTEAREQAAKGETEAAIQSYRNAIAWRSPFNPYPQAAAEELYRLAENITDNRALKLEALWALKGGLKSSRSFLNPETAGQSSGLLKAAEAALVELYAGERAEGYIEDLHVSRVNYDWQALAQVMFWLWILSTAAAIYSGFNPDGSAKTRPLLCGLGVMALCYAGWLLALSRA